MKSKKLISLLCAAAMTTSAFAGLVTTASAATGDQLASFDFDTADWGASSRTDKWTTTYAEYVDATKPAEVTGKSMIMNSLEGNNCSVMHAMTVTTSPTGSYNLDFDLRLTSADYKTGQTQNEDKSWTTNDRELGTGDEKYEYVYGFGNTAKPTSGDATGNNMFEIRVKGDSVYVNNGSADLYDTTIDVPITGAWFHFDVTADTKSGKYKGTITPYAEGAEAVEIPSMSFQSATATALTAFFASSVRYDGSIKGLVKDGVLDNVVITEAENINPSNITIKYVDATSGEEIKASETVSSETGSSYTAPASKKANFTIDGDTENYYKYVAEGSVDTIESVSSDESNNVITLKFEKAALVNFTVNAVTTSGATIKQLYTKKAMPGATETFFNTIYITEAGQSYKAKDTTNYKVEATVADEGTVANVVYKKADNLVFYSEAEDYADCTYEEGKSLDNDSRYSGGKVRVPSIGNNYTNGFATDPVAEAGEYILSFNSHDNKRGIIVAKVSADGTITDLTGTTEDDYFKAGAYESEPIALEAGDYFKLYCAEGKAPWGSKQINNVDYVAVTTPVEAVEPEAAVTYTKADRKATVTVTNAEDVADTVTAVLVHASYTGDVLKSVTAHDVTMNVAGDGSIAADVLFGEDEAIREGDKLMVWDSLSGMKAMAAVPYVITADEADAIVTYTVTVNEAITGGTVVASVKEAEEGDTVTLTVTPNADMQLKADSLKVMNGEDAVAVTQGTEANTYTFTMPAGNVTVTAEFEAVAVEPDEITGTVTVSGTAKVGETLTAVVSGLNEGATAKYEWQANTGADGAYENIADATAATFVVTEDLVGKTIKVVVTADGYTGTIESAATAAVVAADEEPVAAPTVETATLHDTAGVVQDNELYTEGSYKVTTTAEDGYTNVAIAAENLKKHQNGDSPATAGYWVGAKVTAPADTKITGYYFSKDAYVEGTSQFTDCDENEISFYTNAGAADQKIWAAVELNDDKVYVYKLDTIGVKVVEEAVPYDENTVTFDEEGDSAIFVDFSRVTSSIETSTTATANTTKVNRVATGTGGQSGARYDKYSDAYKATGDNVEVSFDFTVPTRNAYVSVRGTSADTSDRNNDATERIFTIGCESSYTLKIWGADTTAIEVANTSADTNWYHVEAVVNNTAKTTSIKVYNYKANNNYENETPLYENAALGFRDNSVAGVVGMDYFSSTNNAIMELDNVKIYDATYVAPMDVTVTAPDEGDGTLKVDKTQVKAEDVITITATPAAGKKVTAVKVNGENVTYDGGYKYTVTGDEDAIVVTAEFARADAATVEVAGASSVQKGETAQYTATIKDEAGTVLTGDITWSVEGAQDTSNTKIENGLLTVGADETASTLTVKATTKKDVANDTDETTVEGTTTVTVATEAVYNVTKGAETNGTFTVSATQATEGTEITVVPSPAEGYQVKEVSYSKTEDGSEKQVVTDDSGYKFVAPAYDVTVNVEFEAISYTITDETVEGNGNSVAIKVNGEDATTATVGQTVTIEPIVAQGYKVDTVAVMNGEQPVEVSNNTFTMPAANVTVNVTFVAWDGIYGSVNFDSEEVATISGNSSKDIATAVGTWKVGGTSSSSQTKILTIADDNTLNTGFTTGSGNCFQGWGNNTHEYLEMTSEVSPVTNNGIKISFDMYFGAVAGIGDAYLSIGDQTPANALLHLVANSNTNYTNITVGAEDTLNAQEIYYYDPEAEIYKSTGIATGSAINVVETINADGTATVELKSGETTKSFTIKVSPTTSVGRFNVQGVRISGSAKGTALIALDNVLVTAPWYTAE